MLSGLGILITTSLISIAEIEDNVFKAEEEKLITYFDEKYQAKLDIAISNAIDLSHNQAVITSLQTNDRTLAINRLLATNKAFIEHTKFSNIKIHVHDKDIHSFLRVWKLDKYGDDLSSFRHAIVAVKQTKKLSSPLKLAKLGWF